LGELLGGVRGKTIAVLGLTYKPNTDTLRRSESVALCRWLTEQDAVVRAHDPSIQQRPSELPPSVTLSMSIDEAIRGADAIVVATEWPVFRELTAERLVAIAPGALVLDAGRFLAGSLASDPRIRYVAVGVPAEQGRP
jgi:UDPglucose 6-dehydrogenase